MNWWIHLTTMNDHYIGNIAALILAGMIVGANYQRSNMPKKEFGAIMHLLGNVVLYSCVEIFSETFDGVAGNGVTILLYLLNSLLFILNMLLGFGWVQFIALHLGYEMPKKHQYFLLGLMLLGIVVLTANLFIPLVFSIQNNTYSEDGPLFFVFVIIAGIYLSYTISVYAFSRANGGVLKYFPVWMYVVPVILGVTLESLLGSSLIAICNAIALSTVLGSMQQEAIYRDRLTGLYNRAYLEEVKTKLEKTKNPFVSGIMLDLNNFKSINDNYGHGEGDQALINASNLIKEGVGSYGETIRYAGDEFIVILNTSSKDKIEECAKHIEKNFENYNSTSQKPYQLTVSMGYANFNAESQTVNEFLNNIDKNMYNNKKEYYQTHKIDRRKR